MNKHKMIAILIAPFLALGGYILADIYSTNKDADSDKKLFVTDVCRPVTDQCEILGVGMEMHLKFEVTPRIQRLLPIRLSSKTSLDDVAISLVIAGVEQAPMKMKNIDGKKNWDIDLMPFEVISADNLVVRLVVSYKAALHLVEIPVVY
ncbi:MAG: hypothetical protein V3U71_07245 [Cocleimonas sp.]